jgi:putative copper resistance protein D
VLLAHAGLGEVPAALTPSRLLTAWTFEPLPAFAIVVVAAAYAYGVHRLRARGDRWSRGRSAAFFAGGLGSIVVATQSVLASYDTTLLSVHMVQHMLLNMIAPIFLALGAPLTLALRTLARRPRQLLLSAVHSWYARVLTFPVVAGAIFIANPFVLYFTDLYEWTLRYPLLHDFNHLHFLVVGSLWFWPLLGVDPMPRRLPYWARMLAVFVTMPFHAWLGVSIMSATTVIAEDWYVGMGRTWGASPLADQQTAGGILWASGELVSLIIFGVLFAQWVRASEREAARLDRQLDLQEAARSRQAVAREGDASRPASLPGRVNSAGDGSITPAGVDPPEPAGTGRRIPGAGEVRR